MRVFVAGATGAIGKQLVPRLVAAGHEVVGMTRSESKRALLRELGAEPVVADALDPDQVAEAVARARPEVIVHQLTAIGSLDPRHFDRDFSLTNRLRTEGTDYLLSAGQAVGVRRFVAQSYGAWWYVRTGGPVKSEEDQTLENGERITSPRAFVATVTTRLAIDELRSARARRERYVGEWLPEPILTDERDDPARQAEMADSLSVAMLVLLESLSPEQRAVLLLRDVFDYGYEEIAPIVGKNEDNVRQLASRARRHLEERRPRFQTSHAQRDELARRFFAAAQAGDLVGLEALLAHDVVLTGDGGGKVPALVRSLRGRSRVARILLDWLRRLARIPGGSMRPVEVNAGPGAVLLDGQDRVIGVWALEIAGAAIYGVRSIVNPDKLAHLGPIGDFNSLLAHDLHYLEGPTQREPREEEATGDRGLSRRARE